MTRRHGLVLAGLAALLIAFGWHSATHAVDFPIYHHVGRQVLHGDYTLYPAELDSGAPVPGHGYRYAPVIAFLFAPFALLPLPAAAFVFFALKVAAFAWTIALVARRLGVPDRLGTVMLVAVLAAGGYLVEEFRNGNFHLFAIALVVFALDAASRRQPWRAAAALAVAVATKVTPALVLPYWLLTGRFKAASATLIALVVLWLLPVPVVGVRTNVRLTSQFVRYSVEKLDEADNYALRGVLVRYLEARRVPDPRYPDPALVDLPDTVVTSVWLALLALSAGAVAAVMRHRGTPDDNGPIDWAILLMAMLLASPHSQRPYFSAMSVAAAVLTAIALRRDLGVNRRWVYTVLIVSGAVTTVAPLVFSTRRAALAYESLSPYFVAALATTLLLIVLRLKAHAGPTASVEVR